MKATIAILALACAICAIVFLGVMWFDPNNMAARDALAPDWIRVQRALIYVCALAIAIAVMGKSIAYLRHEWIMSRMVYARQGMLPAVAGGAPLDASHIDYRAQIMSATVQGEVDRLNGGAIKQIINPVSQEVAMLPEDKPILMLPARSSIYSAALPSAPSLMIGVGGNGEQVYLPLRDFGGGVVGGVMGMGKSEAIASMIVGLLRQDASGRGVRLAIADMKGGLDFGRIPNDLAALRWQVAKTRDDAFAMAAATWQEVEWRNRLIADAGYSRLEAYNANTDKPIPYLFLFIDEIRILTGPALQSGGDRAVKALSNAFIEQMVNTISLGRAAGVGVVLATQKPSSSSIPTDIRDICSMRLAFYCTTDDASQAVLGQTGAELLPYEPGHAILVRGDTPRRVRTHLAEITDGAFDRFMGSLSREAVREAVYRLEQPQKPPENGIPPSVPVSVPQDVPPDDEAVKLLIWRTWKRLGSLSATESELYNGQKGGIKFYWVREVVEELERRRGHKLSSEAEG